MTPCVWWGGLRARREQDYVFLTLTPLSLGLKKKKKITSEEEAGPAKHLPFPGLLCVLEPAWSSLQLAEQAGEGKVRGRRSLGGKDRTGTGTGCLS